MAYNIFGGGGYNPYQQYQQPYVPQMQPQTQQNSGLTWVQGIEAMKSYPVGAGQSALLMDSESNCFGIKTVDASGMPLPLRIFDYKERTVSQPSVQPTTSVNDDNRYITREEFESRIAELTRPTERIEKDAE